MRGVLAFELGVKAFLVPVGGDFWILSPDDEIFGNDAEDALAVFKSDAVLFFALGTNPRLDVEFDT